MPSVLGLLETRETVAEVLAETPAPAAEDRQAALLRGHISGVRPRRRGPALDSRVANSLSDCPSASAILC
jgi:hypothetical protein